jgi:hypothetical protein
VLAVRNPIEALRRPHDTGLPAAPCQAATSLAAAQLAACLMLALLNAYTPATMEYAPAGAVALVGGLYLASTLSDVLRNALAAVVSPAAWRR